MGAVKGRYDVAGTTNCYFNCTKFYIFLTHTVITKQDTGYIVVNVYCNTTKSIWSQCMIRYKTFNFILWYSVRSEPGFTNA